MRAAFQSVWSEPVYMTRNVKLTDDKITHMTEHMKTSMKQDFTWKEFPRVAKDKGIQ